MPLNKQKGNMYSFVTDTWNTIKGICPHDCTYCYMKRFKQRPVRFDESELKTDLGEGKFIFVGSSCDMFAEDIPHGWIAKTISHCMKYPKNKYLLQTKNPARYYKFLLPDNFMIGTTIETNRIYKCMGNTPKPYERAEDMKWLDNKKFLTIEPILKFDLMTFRNIIVKIDPEFIAIGADSGNNYLPEPSTADVKILIDTLREKEIRIKDTLKRLL